MLFRSCGQGNRNRLWFANITVVHEVLANEIVPGFVCLSGPSFAREVVEGQPTAKMPITDEVYAVLYEGKTARAAASDLMMRPLRSEFNN